MVYLDFVHRHTGELVKRLGEMDIEEAEMRIMYDPTERYEVSPGVEVPVRYQIVSVPNVEDVPDDRVEDSVIVTPKRVRKGKGKK